MIRNVPARLDATRYTLCGDPNADVRVTQDLARLGAGLEAELGDDLKALILVGPYARGEGSVVAQDDELHADGSYPLIALRQSLSRTNDPRIDQAAREWSAHLGVDVRLRSFPVSALPDVSPTLLWMDVGMSHFKLVAGVPGHLQALRQVSPAELPADAITRLLSDAARDLALARLEPDPALSKLCRAAHHAVLSCGDAWLLGLSLYAPSIVDRAAALDTVDCPPWLRVAYRDAVRYCARPDLWSPPGGEGWFGDVLEQLRDVHLSMEHRRVGAPLDIARIARWGGRLFTQARARRGRTLNPLRALLLPERGGEERLYRVGMLLAYGPDERSRRAAARLLGLAGSRVTSAGIAVALRQLTLATQRTRSDYPIDFAHYD